ncbi:hypothetical protein TGPRC2_270720 [Toxoplasma gondii TgCatPRC2]|uniref:HEAT repeat-containing protein n=1 Tax=Toxoplasma gondii TgCatPRC2 TaxID=1130821 RepID=A0A151HP52_TOXGO|nr:hypothetical protein TGPRC2_270720 [Toxoplasma gondii TgCatPRC2]
MDKSSRSPNALVSSPFRSSPSLAPPRRFWTSGREVSPSLSLEGSSKEDPPTLKLDTTAADSTADAAERARFGGPFMAVQGEEGMDWLPEFHDEENAENRTATGAADSLASSLSHPNVSTGAVQTLAFKAGQAFLNPSRVGVSQCSSSCVPLRADAAREPRGLPPVSPSRAGRRDSLEAREETAACAVAMEEAPAPGQPPEEGDDGGSQQRLEIALSLFGLPAACRHESVSPRETEKEVQSERGRERTQKGAGEKETGVDGVTGEPVLALTKGEPEAAEEAREEDEGKGEDGWNEEGARREKEAARVMSTPQTYAEATDTTAACRDERELASGVEEKTQDPPASKKSLKGNEAHHFARLFKQHAVYRRVVSSLDAEGNQEKEKEQLQALLEKGDFAEAAVLLTSPLATSGLFSTLDKELFSPLSLQETEEDTATEAGGSSRIDRDRANCTSVSSTSSRPLAGDVPSAEDGENACRHSSGETHFPGAGEEETGEGDESIRLARQAEALACEWRELVRGDPGDARRQQRILRLSLKAAEALGSLAQSLRRPQETVVSSAAVSSETESGDLPEANEGAAEDAEGKETGRQRRRLASLATLQTALVRAMLVGDAALHALTEVSLRREADELVGGGDCGGGLLSVSPRTSKRREKAEAKRERSCARMEIRRGSERSNAKDELDASEEEPARERKDRSPLRECLETLPASFASSIFLLHAVTLLRVLPPLPLENVHASSFASSSSSSSSSRFGGTHEALTDELFLAEAGDRKAPLRDPGDACSAPLTGENSTAWLSQLARGLKLQCKETIAVLFLLSGSSKDLSGHVPLQRLQRLLPAAASSKLFSLFTCICRLLRRILLAASTVVTAGAPGTATADKVPRGVCTPQSSSSRPLSASDSPVATSGSWPVSAAGSSIPPSAVASAAASELPSALRSAFLRPSVFSQEDLHLVVAGVSALVSQQSSGGRSGKASEALQAATDLLATFFLEIPSLRPSIFIALLSSVPVGARSASARTRPGPGASHHSSSLPSHPDHAPQLLAVSLPSAPPPSLRSSPSAPFTASDRFRSAAQHLLPAAVLVARLLQCLFLPRLRRQRSGLALARVCEAGKKFGETWERRAADFETRRCGEEGKSEQPSCASRRLSRLLWRGERVALLLTRFLLARACPNGMRVLDSLRGRDAWNCGSSGFALLLTGTERSRTGYERRVGEPETKNAESEEDEADDEILNDFQEGFKETLGFAGAPPDGPHSEGSAPRAMLRRLVEEWGLMSFYPSLPGAVLLFRTLVASLLHILLSILPVSASIAGRLKQRGEEPLKLLARVLLTQKSFAPPLAGLPSRLGTAPSLSLPVSAHASSTSTSVSTLFAFAETALSLLSAAAPFLFRGQAPSASLSVVVRPLLGCPGESELLEQAAETERVCVGKRACETERAPASSHFATPLDGAPSSSNGPRCCVCQGPVLPETSGESMDDGRPGSTRAGDADVSATSSTSVAECEDCGALAHAACAGVGAECGGSSSSSSEPLSRSNVNTGTTADASVVLVHFPWMCEGCALRRIVAHGLKVSADRCDASLSLAFADVLPVSAWDQEPRTGGVDETRSTQREGTADAEGSHAVGSRGDMLAVTGVKRAHWLHGRRSEDFLPFLSQTVVGACLLLAHLNGPGGRAASARVLGAQEGVSAGEAQRKGPRGDRRLLGYDRASASLKALEAFGRQEETHDTRQLGDVEQVAVRVSALALLDAAQKHPVSFTGAGLEPKAPRAGDSTPATRGRQTRRGASQKRRQKGKAEKERLRSNAEALGGMADAEEGRQRTSLTGGGPAPPRNLPNALWEAICAIEWKTADEMRRGFGLSKGVRLPRPRGQEARGADSETVERRVEGATGLGGLGSDPPPETLSRSGLRLACEVPPTNGADAEHEEDESACFDDGQAARVWDKEVVSLFFKDLRVLFMIAVQSSLPRRYSIGIKRGALTALSSCLQEQPEALQASDLQQALWESLRDPAPAVRDRALVVIEKILFSSFSRRVFPPPSWADSAAAGTASKSPDQKRVDGDTGRSSVELFAAFLASSLVHDPSAAVRLQAVRMLRNYYLNAPHLHAGLLYEPRGARASSASCSFPSASLSPQRLQMTRDAFLSLARRLHAPGLESRHLRASIADLFAEFFFLLPFSAALQESCSLLSPSTEKLQSCSASSASSSLSSSSASPSSDSSFLASPPFAARASGEPPAALIWLLSHVAASVRGRHWPCDEQKGDASQSLSLQVGDACMQHNDTLFSGSQVPFVQRLLALVVDRLSHGATVALALGSSDAATPPRLKGQRHAGDASPVPASPLASLCPSSHRGVRSASLSRPRLSSSGQKVRRGRGVQRDNEQVESLFRGPSSASSRFASQASHWTKRIVHLWLEGILRLFLRCPLRCPPEQEPVSSSGPPHAAAALRLLELAGDFLGTEDPFGACELLVRSGLPLLLPLFKAAPPLPPHTTAILGKSLGFVATLCQVVGARERAERQQCRGFVDAGEGEEVDVDEKKREEGEGTKKPSGREGWETRAFAAGLEGCSLLFNCLRRELDAGPLEEIHRLVEVEPLVVKDGVRCLYTAATCVTGDLENHVGRLLACSLAPLYDARAKLEALAEQSVSGGLSTGLNMGDALGARRAKTEETCDDGKEREEEGDAGKDEGGWERETRAGTKRENDEKTRGEESVTGDAETMPNVSTHLPSSSLSVERERGDQNQILAEGLHNVQYASWVAARLFCELDFDRDFFNDLPEFSDEEDKTEEEQEADETGKLERSFENVGKRQKDFRGVCRPEQEDQETSKKPTPVRDLPQAEVENTPRPSHQDPSCRRSLQTSHNCLRPPSGQIRLRLLRRLIRTLTPHLPRRSSPVCRVSGDPLSSVCIFTAASPSAGMSPRLHARSLPPPRGWREAEAADDEEGEERDGENGVPGGLREKSCGHQTGWQSFWDLPSEFFRLLVDLLFLFEVLRLPSSVVWRSFAHFLGRHPAFVCHRSVHTLLAAVLARGASGLRMSFRRKRGLRPLPLKAPPCPCSAAVPSRHSACNAGHRGGSESAAALAQEAFEEEFGSLWSVSGGHTDPLPRVKEEGRDADDKEGGERRDGGPDRVKQDEEGGWEADSELVETRDSPELQAALQGLGSLLLAFEAHAVSTKKHAESRASRQAVANTSTSSSSQLVTPTRPRVPRASAFAASSRPSSVRTAHATSRPHPSGVRTAEATPPRPQRGATRVDVSELSRPRSSSLRETDARSVFAASTELDRKENQSLSRRGEAQEIDASVVRGALSPVTGTTSDEARAGAISACEAAQSLTIHLPALLEILLPSQMLLDARPLSGEANCVHWQTPPFAVSPQIVDPSGLSERSARLCLQVLRVFQRQGLVHSGDLFAHAFACLCAASGAVRQAAGDLLLHALSSALPVSSHRSSLSSSRREGSGRAAQSSGSLLASGLHEALFLAVKFTLTYQTACAEETKTADRQEEGGKEGQQEPERGDEQGVRESRTKSEEPDARLTSVAPEPFSLLPSWTTPAPFAGLCRHLSRDSRAVKEELLWSVAGQLDRLAEPTRLALLLTLLPSSTFSIASSSSSSLFSSGGPAPLFPRSSTLDERSEHEGSAERCFLACLHLASPSALSTTLSRWLVHPALHWLASLLPRAQEHRDAGLLPACASGVSASPDTVSSASTLPAAPPPLAFPLNLLCLPVLVLLYIQQTVSLLLSMPLASEGDALLLVCRLADLVNTRIQRIQEVFSEEPFFSSSRRRESNDEEANASVGEGQRDGDELRGAGGQATTPAAKRGFSPSTPSQCPQDIFEEGEEEEESFEASVVLLCQVLCVAFAVLCRRALMRVTHLDEAKCRLFRAAQARNGPRGRTAGAPESLRRRPSHDGASASERTETEDEEETEEEIKERRMKPRKNAKRGRAKKPARGGRPFDQAMKRRKTEKRRWSQATSEDDSSLSDSDSCTRDPPRRRSRKRVPRQGGASKDSDAASSADFSDSSEEPATVADRADAVRGRRALSPAARVDRRAARQTDRGVSADKQRLAALRRLGEAALPPETQGVAGFSSRESEALVARVGRAWRMRLERLGGLPAGETDAHAAARRHQRGESLAELLQEFVREVDGRRDARLDDERTAKTTQKKDGRKHRKRKRDASEEDAEEEEEEDESEEEEENEQEEDESEEEEEENEEEEEWNQGRGRVYVKSSSTPHAVPEGRTIEGRINVCSRVSRQRKTSLPASRRDAGEVDLPGANGRTSVKSSKKPGKVEGRHYAKKGKHRNRVPSSASLAEEQAVGRRPRSGETEPSRTGTEKRKTVKEMKIKQHASGSGTKGEAKRTEKRGKKTHTAKAKVKSR